MTFASLLLVSVLGGAMDLEVGVSARRVEVGQPNLWWVEVAAPPEHRVRLLELPNASSAVYCVEQRVHRTKEDRVRVEVTWMGTEPGDFVLGEAVLSVLDAAGHELARPTTDGIEVEVTSTVAAGETPVMAPLITGAQEQGAGLWLSVGLGLVFLVGLVLWLGRGGGARAPVDVPMTAQEAMRQLESLATDLDPARFHDRLAAIVRSYLEHRFQVPALTFASEEVLAVLTRDRLGGTGDRLARILEDADRHKFAAAPSLREEAAASVDRVRDFIRVTASEGEEGAAA